MRTLESWVALSCVFVVGGDCGNSSSREMPVVKKGRYLGYQLDGSERLPQQGVPKDQAPGIAGYEQHRRFGVASSESAAQ